MACRRLAVHQRARPAPRRGEGPVSAEEAEAKTFDERLRYLSRHGGFVALAVAPRYARPAAERLASEYGVERVSVDDRLIAAMREEAVEAGADWRTVIETDSAGPGSPDWPLLVTLVKAAVERLERSLARPDGTLLLEHAGLLARYGQLGLLERLRDRAGRRDSGLHGAWVLVPSGQMPAVAGQAIPVITPGQWATVPDLWVRQKVS